MKIAFDLDGVICDLDLASFHYVFKEDGDSAEKGYYLSRKVQFNPYLLLHEDDEAIIITARRYGWKGLTEEWLKAQGIKIPIVHEATTIPPSDFEKLAEWKADIINREKVELYIDDNPAIVKTLRKLCPKTTILQYGARRQN